MKHYKKRTVALCLASVLAIVGAFGAENYKNSLMSLRINSGSDGYVNITAYTQKPLEEQVEKTIVDSNTYILNFPDTNNSTIAPMVTGYNNISDIKINTFPYTREKSGYTQVIIKTVGSPKIVTNTKLFLPANTEQSSSQDIQQIHEVVLKDEKPISPKAVKEPNKQFVPSDYGKPSTQVNSSQIAIVFCWIFVIMLLILIVYNISKNKMDSVIGGGHNDFDLDDDTDNKNAKKIKKSGIKTDKTASLPLVASNESYKSNSLNEIKQEESKQEEQKEEDDDKKVVLDLDLLYQKKPMPETQENIDNSNGTEPEVDELADFLSEFIFEEEPTNELIEETKLFDEDLYNDIIKDSTLDFSSGDVKKINQLMQIEITEDTITKLKDFLNAAKNKPKPLTQKQILENLITTFSIKQNITFTHEDIESLKKIMDVELDSNFISDLRTNPERVNIVKKDIENKKVTHKTSEIITMNVKDSLPDLSKELKKQDNKKILSEVKPQVIYYSEGYDVDKLVVNLDLAKELQVNKSNEFKPSYSAPIVENGYEYTTLVTDNVLPDLSDVKEHPTKYIEEIKQTEKADETALLKSISNVTFKPFYEEPAEKPDILEEDIKENNLNSIENSILTPSQKMPKKVTKINNEAQKLLKLIENQQIKRELKQNQRIEENNTFKKDLEKIPKKETQAKINTQEAPKIKKTGDNIIKTATCDSKFNCSLVKTENGYEIFGCVEENQVKLKQFEDLKSTNLQVRVNDKKQDGTIQYLIKIGLQKFVVNVKDNNMEFVMDLC